MPTDRHSVTLRFLAAPTDAGLTGTVDGGRVLEWIDKAGYAAAAGWSGRYCVTAYVGNVQFRRPVLVGELVEAQATIVYTGRTSMHIQVIVRSSDPREAEAVEKTRCLIIFVAMDENRKPTPVPKWEPTTEAETYLEASAIRRIELRKDIEEEMARQVYSDAGTGPRTLFRFLAAPTDVNWGGNVHGGTVMRWMDETASACAAGWLHGPAIAVYAGGVRFYRPLKIGHVVEVEARLLHTGKTSMHMSVHVRSGDPKTGEMELTTHSLIVFVALDKAGASVLCKRWQPATEEDHALDKHARRLIQLRSRARKDMAAAAIAGTAVQQGGDQAVMGAAAGTVAEANAPEQ